MMEKGIEMQTEAKGGLGASIRRLLSGAGVMLSSFRHIGEGMAKVVLGPSFYSKVIPYELTAEKQLMCQRHGYLCGDEVRVR